MGKEVLTFGDIEIDKNKFHHHKSPIFLKKIDIEKISVYKKIYKYLIGYLHNDHKVKPLYIRLHSKI